jgi:N-sulfoglucosamine sulfohydrolase
MPLLTAGPDPSPNRLFTVFHQTSAKQRFEMRRIQDQQYGYIWNPWADGQVTYRAENMWGLTWPSMLAAAEDNRRSEPASTFYLTRNPEELYDLQADPNCLTNLATDPNHTEALQQRRETLAEWLRDSQDRLTEPFGDCRNKQVTRTTR